ncbi:MAG TPA: cyclic nucleotide-binding domain-containing protein [Pyrinomonadaceae bacterium]|nr:cyclic nucleotide-binding domain-containing protein [Pyrinomonadaceae bacterium]
MREPKLLSTKVMPREITKHATILDAIQRIDLISELTNKTDGYYTHELDLEVIVYGRNYNGKKVGPYLRLFEFSAGEEVIRQGDWGNTFYITVDGHLDVYVSDDEVQRLKIGSIPPGVSFGETAILTGSQRNATIVVPPNGNAIVFEVTRPALRLLRKLGMFGQNLDVTYRKHVLGRTLEKMWRAAGDDYANENLERLSRAAQLMIYGKQHVLIQEGEPIDRLILIVNGWLQRSLRLGAQWVADASTEYGWKQHVDFLGAGHWLGLEGVPGEARWDYTATVMQRTEVLEIPLAHIRQDARLRDALRQSLHSLALAYDEVTPASSAADQLSLSAVEKEIMTGIVDATNLLVMDMDLCVRCGNCSLACHKVHGRSRIMRRGIYIERPITLRRASAQRVLSPAVCMHCQDPLCLTGCPTGAIGRFSNGQIDIDPKTCIGCGDCATQCPYNAITMVPRRGLAPEPRTLLQRLQSVFNLRHPAPPPPVTEVDNNVAVTCNLCHNTPLNPRGANSHVYSCQENCPTGALVRVNPREYFTEAKNRISLVYRDQTQAVGRNIHQSDPVAKLLRVWGVATILAVTCAAVWGLLRYGLETPLGTGRLTTMRWLTGLAGLGSVMVAFAYTLRRQIYRRRAGPLRYWMQVHVYAGIAAGVLLLLHAGSVRGGGLTSLLTISFYLTILSGFLGVVCYLFCPRLLTDLEGEPLLVEDLRARREELREKLADIDRHCTPKLAALIRRHVYERFFVLSFLIRQYLRREELSALLAAAQEETVTESGGTLDQQSRSLLLEAVETAVTLRRVDALIYLHQLLKLWLLPHVWSAILTIALMCVHIAQVILAAAR